MTADSAAVVTSHGPVTPTHASAGDVHHSQISLPAGTLSFRHLFDHLLHPLRTVMTLAGIDFNNPTAAIDTLVENFIKRKYPDVATKHPDLQAQINAAVEADTALACGLLQVYAVSKVETQLEKLLPGLLDKLATKYPQIAPLVAQLKAGIPAPKA